MSDNKMMDVVGIGNAIVDVLAPTEDAVLESLGIAKGAMTLVDTARAAEIYAERYAEADGRVAATFQIVWLSGWAPHSSQQKPLRPGSATARLADALTSSGKKET